MLLPGALLFTLSISLNKFLLVEILGTKHLIYLVIVDFNFKTCICAFYIKKEKNLLQFFSWQWRCYDDRFKIEGYNLIRSDHPSGSKKDGVVIYFMEHIPLVRRNNLCTLSNSFEVKSASLPVFTDHLAKLVTNFRTFAQTSILLWFM